MSILRRVNDHNNNEDSLYHIAEYITTKPYTDWDENVAVIGCRKDKFLNDMFATKKAYHKNTGKMYEHSVLSITPDLPYMKDSDYMEIGRRIASHRHGFQCAYALHKDTSIRHLHFLFNSVSYRDGKKFSQGPSELNSVKTFINHVLEDYNLDPIKEGMLGCIDTNKYFFGISGYSFLEIDDDSADDRDLFLAPPPPVENQYVHPDAPIPGAHMFLGGRRSFYNNSLGGYLMKKHFNQYIGNSPYTPMASQSSSSFYPQTNSDDQTLQLVNVNNICLESNSDLAAAARDISEAFSDNARASAEAMAELQKRGCKANINLTTINNFYVDSTDEGNDNSIIDIPPTDLYKK